MLKEYFPIAEVGQLQEDSSNILDVMKAAFEVSASRWLHLAVVLWKDKWSSEGWSPLVSFQSIRSKMSIRAENKPKAFEAQFLKTSGEVSQYGNFDVKPGDIVRY